MRRKDRETDRDFALAVCDRCAYAVLAMLDTDGGPYCLPLSIARDGDNIYFHAATGGHKTDCLRADPRVCLTCVGDTRLTPEDFSTDYESAVVRGQAAEVTDIAEKTHALCLISQRYAAANMAAFEDTLNRHIAHTAVWKITIDDITGKRRHTHRDA